MRQKLSIVLVLILAAVPTAAQDKSQRTIRFAAMDENRDGVITRQEWRGSAQSFQTHDWNGDGVLSGDEVRATISSPTGRHAGSRPSIMIATAA